MIIGMQAGASVVTLMSTDKKKQDVDRNYSEETFYTDSSEDVRSKCKSAATLLQKRRQLRPIIGSGNPYRNATRLMTLASPSKNNVSLIAQKIMSAKVLRVKQLQNELSDAHIQLNEVAQENRLLKTLQKRQDMALKKYEGTQAELPQLIRSHNEEIRTLKSKLKQAKCQCRELEGRLKVRESELAALREQHKHLLKLSKDKHLGEREQLQQQIELMQDQNKEQDKKVQMLTRKVMLEGKNYKHQLSTEIARHKTTAKELDVALDKIAQLETLVETKEKYIAANLPRMHSHQSVSLVSLGPPARFRIYQPQDKSTDLLPHGGTARDGEGSDGEEEGDNSETEEQAEVSLRRGRAGLRRTHSGQSQFEAGDEDEDEEDEDEFEQQESSESTEVHTYTSQISTSASGENVPKERKADSPSESESRSSLSHKLAGKLKALATQSSFQSEMECSLDKLGDKRNSLRRYSVGGDSELITEDPNTPNARRGSVNGGGDNEKKGKEMGFISTLMTEIDKQNFSRRNTGGKNYVPIESYSPSGNKGSRKPSNTDKLNTGDSTQCVATGEESPQCMKSLLKFDDKKEVSEVNFDEMSVEEGKQRLKNISRTWDEIQNKIKEETNKAQSMMDKYDEELDTRKLTGIPESYNKKHLLAALKAIDAGAEPIDLVDDGKERKASLTGINKPKKLDQHTPAVDGLLRPGPTDSTASIRDDGKKDHSPFWEDEAQMPKSKTELMQELFGGQKLDNNFYLDPISLSSPSTLTDSAEPVSPLRNRMQRK